MTNELTAGELEETMDTLAVERTKKRQLPKSSVI